MNKTSYQQFRERVQKTRKTFFSSNDLKKFYQGKTESLAVLLSNWKKNGWIYHLGRDYYTFDLSQVDYLNLANTLDEGSFISFEYALYYYNLIDQVPTTITLATQKRSRQIEMGNYVFEYTHLKGNLLFEIKLIDKVYIASPEKALGDLIYLVALGKRSVDLSSLEKEKIDKNKLINILNKFPKHVYRKAGELGLL